VRRMAAIDMFGSRGTRFRRRIVTVEFLAAPALAGVLGALFVVRGAPVLWSVELIGDGLNYVPLALHAIGLSGATRLDAELAGVDIQRELRRYGPTSLLLFVPGLIFLFGFRPGDWKRRRPA
jgi:hypothetical protein